MGSGLPSTLTLPWGRREQKKAQAGPAAVPWERREHDWGPRLEPIQLGSLSLS